MDIFVSKISEGEGIDDEQPKSSEESLNADSGDKQAEGNDAGMIPTSFPEPSKRRRSTTVSEDQQGCYLVYDRTQEKWVAIWSPVYVLEAVAFLTPHVKVPQFKYSKKERVVLEGEKKASRDVKQDYLQGFCSFFKLIRDFKGDLTILPSAEDLELKELLLLGLHNNEIIHFDKFDFTYLFIDLDCVALVPKRCMDFSGKHMEQAIFMGKVNKVGFGLSLKTRS